MTKTTGTLLTEAYDIADGKTMKIGTTEHIKALVAELRKVVSAAEHVLAESTPITSPSMGSLERLHQALKAKGGGE